MAKKNSSQTAASGSPDQTELKAKPAAKAKKMRGQMPKASHSIGAGLRDVTEMAVAPIMPPPRDTKIRRLGERLQDRGGASLVVLMELTGWQAHTVRAALSGLRKKGWAVTRERVGEEMVYAIDPEAPIPASETDVVEVLEDIDSSSEGAPDPGGAEPGVAGHE